ncbi:MAG: hypothetical protein MSG64_06380 [Pyrinomonadaceae bacterium MAG19_C2-C3]|nr:hypothetical protein [Pyrinomonadaceae bacterium MAG19_C2-C3]
MTYDYTTTDLVIGDMDSDNLSTEDLDVVESYIAPASAFIDNYLGVKSGHFKPAGTTPTQKAFYGDGTDFIKLPIYVDDENFEVTLPSGYVAEDLEVRNGFLVRIYTPEYQGSFTLMDVDRWNRFVGRVPHYANTGWAQGTPILVTARWGYEAVPDDIELACRRLVQRLWRTRDAESKGVIGDIQRDDGTIITLSLPPFIKLTLDTWKAKLSQGIR